MRFDGKEFGKEVAAMVKDFVERQLSPLVSRIEALEQNGIGYAGVYQRAVSYRKGTMVTQHGSMWIALVDVPEGQAPGDHPGFWQCCVKSGRDGKDVRP